MAVREFKKQKSAGKDGHLTLHALVAKACRMLAAIMSENSELERILGEIESAEEVDFEYISRILDALQKARDRIDARMNKFKGDTSSSGATRMMNRASG
jgi:hypothetical protein